MLREAVSKLRQVGLYAAIVTGCASWLPAPVPMRTSSYRADPNKQARCLLVFLPGMGDSDKDFAEHGFMDELRKRKLDVDVISANATLGYYGKQTLRDRVMADILVPARKAGYQQIWFAGISMGGLGSVLMAQAVGRELAGIVLIAPFLGDEDLQTEIKNAGGLAKWQPAAKIDPKDYSRDLWRWLKQATEKPETAPPIYLASGDQDKLSMGHRLLGATLPPERRFRTRGGHDWAPWLILWNDFLDHSDFQARCSEH